MANSKFEMILCIVNAGFSEMVMDAAKEVGARGGTVIHARGTANQEAEQFFHITIQPDKEMVLILVPVEIKDNVLHAIYRSAGLKTEGQGIAFSLPVDEVVGISSAASAPAQAKQPEDKAVKANETEADKPEDNATEDKEEVKPSNQD